MANFLDRLMNTDGRKIKEIERKIKPAEDMAEKFASMPDEEVQAMTGKLKARLANGETLDDIMPVAFATAREACRRVIGEYPYHVQLIGAAVLLALAMWAHMLTLKDVT